MHRGPLDGSARAALRRGRMILLVTSLAAATVLLTGGPAAAQWLLVGSATARADAASIPRVGTPSVTPASGDRATISWTGVQVTPTRSVTGYVVRRHPDSGAVSIACTVAAPEQSCTDPQPVAGLVSYTVAATFAGWSGPESVPVAYDNVAPVTAVSASTTANAQGWWTSSPVRVTLSATDSGSGVGSITYRVGAAAPVTVNAAGTWVDVTAQGATTITYFATDQMGNVEPQRTYTLNVDSVAPAAPTGLRITPDTGASTADGVTSSIQPQVLGSAEPGSTVEISVDGMPRWSVSATAGGTFAAGGDAGNTLAAGAHVVSVRVVDPAGNVSPAATMNIVVDTTAPSPVTVSSPAQNATVTQATWGSGCSQPGACGTATDLGTPASGVASVLYELRNGNGSSARCWNGSTFSGAGCLPALMTASGTSTWTVAVPFTSLPAGSTTLRAYAVDLAGNVGPETTRRFSK